MRRNVTRQVDYNISLRPFIAPIKLVRYRTVLHSSSIMKFDDSGRQIQITHYMNIPLLSQAESI